MTSRPQNLAVHRLAGYRKPDPNTQPEYNYPPYASTVRRSPSRPLVMLPTTLSEVTGPLFGPEHIGPNDHDLTLQGEGAPIGERIIVSGRVLDGNGRAGAAYAGRDLAGERRGPLPAPARPAQCAARPQLPGRPAARSPTPRAAIVS